MFAFTAPVALSSRGRRHGIRATCNRPRMTAGTPLNLENSNSESKSNLAGLRPGEMAVRFTNTPGGPDVVAAAKPGDILLQVGDSVGITIPRACVSGLCGSCTCDLVDPSMPNGLQTVRACQTSVLDITGTGELVVDLARMKEARGRRGINPMARFDNMDTEYVAGAAPKRMDKRGRVLTATMECPTCDGSGDVECYNCDGAGFHAENGETCMLCNGTGTLRCADCQGTGVIMAKRENERY